jgi:hypothetical protein
MVVYALSLAQAALQLLVSHLVQICIYFRSLALLAPALRVVKLQYIKTSYSQADALLAFLGCMRNESP